MPQYLVRVTRVEPPQKRPTFEYQKRWHIYIDGGQVRTFGTKREADQFLADMSAFLDLKLRETNALVARVYADYRTIWFRLPTGTVRDVSRLFHDLDSTMQRDIVRSGHRTLFENLMYMMRQTDILTAIIDRLASIDHSTNTDYRARLRLNALETERLRASYGCYAENRDHILALDQRMDEPTPVSFPPRAIVAMSKDERHQ